MSIVIPLPKISGLVIYHDRLKIFATGNGFLKDGPVQSPPRIWRNISALKAHLEDVLDPIMGAYDMVARTKTIYACYKGCQVYDIPTGNPVDFNIYRWYETTDFIKGYVDKGFTLIYEDINTDETY